MSFWRKKDSLGVDISDHSIEVIMFTAGEKLASARAVLESGIVEGGVIVDSKALVAKLIEVLHKLHLPDFVGLRPAVTSLPEKKSYVYCFDLPLGLKGEELEHRIVERVKQVVPVDLATLNWDYLVRVDKEEQAILFAAAPRQLVEDYIETFKLAGLSLDVLDIESLALGRALLAVPAKNHALIIDLGNSEAGMSFFDDAGVLRLSASLPIGGQHLTTAVAEALEIDEKKAEEKKCTQGLLVSKNNIVAPVLEAKLKTLVRGLNQALAYYEKKSGQKIEDIMLVGGSALLPGLPAWLAKQLTRSVEIGNPFYKLGTGVNVAEAGQAVLYANAIGLVLLSRDSNLTHLNLVKPGSVDDTAWQKHDEEESVKPSDKIIKGGRKKPLVFIVIFAIITIAFLAAVVYYQIVVNIKPKTKIDNVGVLTETVIPSQTIVETNIVPTSTPLSTDLLITSSSSTSTLTTEVTSSPNIFLDATEVSSTMITILDTPTGWLKVRDGSGGSFAEIGRVIPGDQLELLKEEAGWSQLKLKDGSTGWVSSKYVNKSN